MIVASSCSLLHSPLTLGNENLNNEIKQWLSFADQKVVEIADLAATEKGERFEQE